VSPALTRRLNAVFVLSMCATLLGAYGVQFILRELPCPRLSECPDNPVSFRWLPTWLGRPCSEC